MNRQTPSNSRFTVRELGPRDFVIHDNVSQLDYGFFFTRKFAQEAADRRNSARRVA
jgi:hypothetical protein